MLRRKLAHIVNPVAVKESSDLFIAQPITFESMRVAKTSTQGNVDVGLYTAQYEEDHPIIPDYFSRTPDLSRSILDFGVFQAKRKLPLIADILGRLYEASDAEYFIYTNVDIALQPHFYTAVNAIIDSGYDAFVINRRTLPSHYKSVNELPLMYADIGQSHPGYDCFIFARSLVPRFMLGKVCIGVPKIGIVLVANIICNANRFKEFTDLRLTFHIGNDGAWQKHGVDKYHNFNKDESEKILSALAPRFNVNTLPAVGMPILANYFQWLKARTDRSVDG